jgi:phospholipase/carboxylesterase
VVALERAEATRQQLLDLGYTLTWKTYNMPHSVCMEEVADIAAFLRRVLV